MMTMYREVVRAKIRSQNYLKSNTSSMESFAMYRVAITSSV